MDETPKNCFTSTESPVGLLEESSIDNAHQEHEQPDRSEDTNLDHERSEISGVSEKITHTSDNTEITEQPGTVESGTELTGVVEQLDIAEPLAEGHPAVKHSEAVTVEQSTFDHTETNESETIAQPETSERTDVSQQNEIPKQNEHETLVGTNASLGTGSALDQITEPNKETSADGNTDLLQCADSEEPPRKKHRKMGSSDIPFSRFSSPHDFHHVLNDWAMASNFAFMPGKERNSDKSITITYTCCRTDSSKKNCSFEVRGKRRKDEDFWTLHKVDVKGTGHNHDITLSELPQDQRDLINLAERQRLCDVPSFYHPSLPPRFVAYPSSEALYDGLNEWAREQGFFFRLGTNWETKAGNQNQAFICGISGCSYSVSGIKLADQSSWSVRAYNARHIEHDHRGASAKNKQLINPVPLPPVTEKHLSFSSLHEALNNWATKQNFAFKTGTSSTGHTNGLISKYMVCCRTDEKGNPCPYNVIVKEGKDHTWSVSRAIKARKEHNHPLEGDLSETQKQLLEAAETRRIIQKPDYSPEHLPSRSISFSDKQELVDYLNKFASERNFKFSIKRSKKEKSGRQLINYECAKSKGSRSTCPYHVYARENKDGVWSISYPYKLKNEHTHDAKMED